MSGCGGGSTVMYVNSGSEDEMASVNNFSTYLLLSLNIVVKLNIFCTSSVNTIALLYQILILHDFTEKC